MNESKQPNAIIPNPATYRNSFIFLGVTFAFWALWIALLVWVRLEAGYWGSEGGLGAIPFAFGAMIFTVITPLHFILTYLKRRNVKTSSLRNVRVAMVVLFLITPIVTIVQNVYFKTRPMPKDEVLNLINNCEVYNVNREVGNRVIVNFKDKDINHHRTNGADPKYFNEYASSAKLNTTCEVQVHDILNDQ